MVIAIAVAGIIFASAIIPTTQIMTAYQEAELDLRNMTTQCLAAVRIEQLVGSIWRDPNAPPGGLPLQAAAADRLQVGSWELRCNQGSIEQRHSGGTWTPVAGPVQSFGLQYLLADGSWTGTPPADQLSRIVAIRFAWVDPASGTPYGGQVVAPDHAFSAGLIQLSPPITTIPYRRADYEREISLPLGSWP